MPYPNLMPRPIHIQYPILCHAPHMPYPINMPCPIHMPSPTCHTPIWCHGPSTCHAPTCHTPIWCHGPSTCHAPTCHTPIWCHAISTCHTPFLCHAPSACHASNNVFQYSVSSAVQTSQNRPRFEDSSRLVVQSSFGLFKLGGGIGRSHERHGQILGDDVARLEHSTPVVERDVYRHQGAGVEPTAIQRFRSRHLLVVVLPTSAVTAGKNTVSTKNST